MNEYPVEENWPSFSMNSRKTLFSSSLSSSEPFDFSKPIFKSSEPKPLFNSSEPLFTSSEPEPKPLEPLFTSSEPLFKDRSPNPVIPCGNSNPFCSTTSINPFFSSDPLFKNHHPNPMIPCRNSNPFGSTTSNELQEYIKFRWLITNQSGVSLSLAKQLFFFGNNGKYQNLNLVFSPMLIQIVLGLIASGSDSGSRSSKEDPTQKSQIVKFLAEESTESVNLLFSRLVSILYGETGGSFLSFAFANSIWFDASLVNLLNPSSAFKQIVEKDYRALSNYVDFQNNSEEEVRQQVNTWFKKQTEELIQEILPVVSDSSSTTRRRIIFANAGYFKGIWKNKFVKYKTRRDKFFLLDGTSIQVPFMTSRDDQYIEECDGFKVLKLPYNTLFCDEVKYSMYIYLPNDPNTKDGGGGGGLLLSLLEKIESQKGFTWYTAPDRVRVRNFRIPRFKIDFGFEASEDLKRLGLELPPLQLSDDDDDVAISGIFHKSFIEVNEQGTLAEAAGLTYDVRTPNTTSATSKQVDFVADHPFLFTIREDSMTGAVLFIGQVVDPSHGYKDDPPSEATDTRMTLQEWLDGWK